MALICMSPARSPSPIDSAHITQLAQDSVKMIESADTMTSANQSIKSADQNKKSSGHRRPSKREKHRKHHHTRLRSEDDQEEDCDSGCECGGTEVEEVPGPDRWSRTMTAVRVLTRFKKKHRSKKEKQENLLKEKRRNVWRRIGFKLRFHLIKTCPGKRKKGGGIR
ncbi:uncharacterized protein LOC111710196 [Eurytemora carolleeae]|uniref:uncharacterized protein LOC111710196 n=1 Tax=Eurytemora carolleeae TaxID=1294199 RepID=UPI000C76435D|nr:uncharacterized protein LOC111710196 [Eurytemora carolleeae]|eukprot:XP_023340027.1 uncharacterized protein LOC111710196 [Eurytemora affinis]